jgi:hypothetical protein
VRHLSIGAIKSHDGHASTKMHVLIMLKYYFGDMRRQFVVEMRRQCHNVSFFYVKNHEVSKLPLLLFEMFAYFQFWFPHGVVGRCIGASS